MSQERFVCSGCLMETRSYGSERKHRPCSSDSSCESRLSAFYRLAVLGRPGVDSVCVFSVFLGEDGAPTNSIGAVARIMMFFEVVTFEYNEVMTRVCPKQT